MNGRTKKLEDDLLLGDFFTSRLHKTRVIIFVFEPEDFDEELNAIRDFARKSANRIELRIGLVTDKKMIKKYKKTTSWFEEDASHNTIVMKRHDGEIISLDFMNIMDDVRNAIGWINRKSLRDIEPFSEQLLENFNYIGLPIVFAFVDFGNKLSDQNAKLQNYGSQLERTVAIEDSMDLVNKVLPELAKKVYKGFVICHVDIATNGDLRTQLGISHLKVPSLTVNLGQKYVAYPREDALTVYAIEDFLKQILQGNIQGSTVN